MDKDDLPAVSGQGLALKPVFSIEEARERYALMLRFVREIMKEGKDYGTIPGTEKPTLYKPGAEKLTCLFGLSTRIVTEERIEDWNGREHNGEPFFWYLYRLGLYRGDRLVAEAEGSANSRENRYRWRWVREDEVPPHLDKKTLAKRGGKVGEFAFAVEKAETTGKYGKPAEYWQKFREAIANGTAIKSKRDTSRGPADYWEIEDLQYRVPNEDIFSLVNTIQKIAYKRAFVAVTLVGCNASDYFSQDLEDLAEDGVIAAEYRVVAEESEQPKPERKGRATKQERKPEGADFSSLWGPFWRELAKYHITTASMDIILGTKNPTEYAKNHEARHLAVLQELIAFAAGMEITPKTLCETLGVDSLAAWVDGDPDDAVEIAKQQLTKAISQTEAA